MATTRKTISSEKEEEVINLFLTLKDNSIKNISEITGVQYLKVSKLINKYLRK